MIGVRIDKLDNNTSTTAETKNSDEAPPRVSTCQKIMKYLEPSEKTKTRLIYVKENIFAIHDVNPKPKTKCKKAQNALVKTAQTSVSTYFGYLAYTSAPNPYIAPVLAFLAFLGIQKPLGAAIRVVGIAEEQGIQQQQIKKVLSDQHKKQEDLDAKYDELKGESKIQQGEVTKLQSAVEDLTDKSEAHMKAYQTHKSAFKSIITEIDDDFKVAETRFGTEGLFHRARSARHRLLSDDAISDAKDQNEQVSQLGLSADG
jgi:hypothetical protein